MSGISWKHMLLHTFIIVVLVLVGLIVAARLFESSFIYFPTKYPAGRWDAKASRLSPEDVWLATSDGVKIHGWFLAGEGADITLLYFHGNGGNITDRIEKLELLRLMDVSIFIIDYRGYGRSGGRPSETGLYADADAAYSYLCHEKGVPPHDIVLYGASLGGAVAVDLASRKPVGAIILESAFTSARDLARKIVPFLHPALYLKTRFDSITKIPHIQAPLLIIHGARDQTVPIEHARRLYKAALQPKTLVKIEGAAHNDIFAAAEELYLESIERFLSEVRESREDR